ncbi:hypothetical protein ABEB36_009503 [Hypothenemus hampei]|uniref:HAT C-terminal dimerisation domain-containing protein n=1 Tax=Hypothenemus hampei TaxID=57062 RepID=A0ABD1EKP3_HYPHA
MTYCLNNVVDEKFVPHKIHKIAAFLWPSYKQLRYLNNADRENVFCTVIQELQNMIIEKTDDSMVFEIIQSHNIDNISDPDYDEDELMAKYIDINENQNNNNCEQQFKIELELYKNSNNINGDILKWWQQNEKKYPLLSNFARKVLCIPASSAASERSFSLANRVLEERRSNLKGENLDAILFLHSKHKNLKLS